MKVVAASEKVENLCSSAIFLFLFTACYRLDSEPSYLIFLVNESFMS